MVSEVGRSGRRGGRGKHDQNISYGSFALKKRLREDILFQWRGGVFLEMNER